MKKILIIFYIIILCFVSFAKEYHVFKNGDDNNPGSLSVPFRTIQAAANIAQPGDVITVHEGTYRERIVPPRGGISDSKRIIYQAAPGDKVEIKGSEIIKGWEKLAGTVWKVAIPVPFFGNYNPYKDVICGDWFNDLGRVNHTGEVYLNGKSLWEAALLENVFNPIQKLNSYDPEGSSYTWFCENDDRNIYIYANFHGADPNKELVEINVRNSCFYPDTTGINYITVRGFHMSQAATQWAAPTAEQIGLIGTNWSKGWIIEDNIIHDSKCSGITLGKDRQSGHNVWSKDRSKDGTEHYKEVVTKVLADGWSKDKIGSHIVRGNTVFNCEQAGICGSLGAIFSQITHNHIYNIWTKRLFQGAEIAGIKIHAPIDVLIKNNRLENVARGIWLDWMAQGTRVTGNLCYNNSKDDLFVEVNHGPYLVDNNIFLSGLSIRNQSEGGAFSHNLVAGGIEIKPQSRTTPYFLPHSTKLLGLESILCGDDRFYNNIFIANYPDNPELSSGLNGYKTANLPVYANGNVYLKGASPYIEEVNFLQTGINPELKVEEDGENVFLTFTFDRSFRKIKTQLVTTQLLGKAKIPDQKFENPDGTPISVNMDYFGKERDKKHPTAGPFDKPGNGKIKLKVW